ncbi:MAG: epimerase [Bacteroidota bacterium]|nr:epimerase [Bacteroidota bacterium]
MVGKSVLLECLEDEDVESVLLINRRPLNMSHKKVTEIIHQDFHDTSLLADAIKHYNACFFCLGVSSVGMKEEQYQKLTYDLTLGFARTLASVNPAVVFCYVSGTGTDETENGKIMWARIKGKTENALLALPFKGAYMFRPGYIQPLKGVKARSGIVNILYVVFTPLYYLLRPFKGLMTDSVSLGKAMINVVKYGYGKRIIEMKDINILASTENNR